MTIIKWDPYLPITAKIHNKGEFFSYFLSLIVSSCWLMLPFDVWPSFPVTTNTTNINNVKASLCWFWQDNRTYDRTFSDCNFFRSFSAVFNCHSLFNKAAYLAALRRLCSPFASRDTDSEQSKTKIYEKNHLLLWISAVIGRYGPHLLT